MTRKVEIDRLWRNVERIREQRPLVHNITNFVVMNTTANALLALGASPIMAHAEEELEELLNISKALVLNIGTLSSPWIASMQRAASLARSRNLPVVLDPVGAGASRLRTDTALSLVKNACPGVIRGNASEIMALAGATGATRGVDSTQSSDAARDAARNLANQHHCTVVASGARDFITNGQEELILQGGSPLLPLVTGMGCTATALIGAFTAVCSSAIDAAVGGMAVMKVAGSMAAKNTQGPGTFLPAFLDALYAMDRQDMMQTDLAGRG
jgi:hydroxyethylthiazole kinase